MKIIFHTGAHYTDDERLLRCLLRNREEFGRRGIAVPGPSKYRTLLKESFKAMEVSPPAQDARDVLIDTILDGEVADRLILSNTHFFGSQRFALIDGAFYPLAAQRLASLRQLFHADDIELFMAIRNPATFLPALLANASPDRLDSTLVGLDLRELRWSDMVRSVRAALPDMPITLWCNEDTPLIWSQILREIAGLEPGTKVAGGFDLLSEIMSAEGMKRFRIFLRDHTGTNEAQRRRVVSAFLDKFAIEHMLEEELDLPGWTTELVEDLTQVYDEDVARIQAMPGVNMIAD